MLAILAALCFLLATFGPNSLGPVELIPLGLAFIALHFVLPWAPWSNRG